jgi:MoxR-like ATPase
MLYKWASTTEWGLVETAFAAASRIYMSGPPGIGKTYAAKLFGAKPVQITLTEDLSVQELAGHYVPEGQQFQWHDGPVTTAMRNGSCLVLHEINRASGAVQDFLLGVLDHPDVAAITLPSGETVRPAPGFVVVATSNTGPECLDPALRSRFEVELRLSEPAPEMIQKLNRDLSNVGDALLDSYKDPSRALDPRKVQAFVSMVKYGVPARQAAILAFGASAPDVVAAFQSRGVPIR